MSWPYPKSAVCLLLCLSTVVPVYPKSRDWDVGKEGATSQIEGADQKEVSELKLGQSVERDLTSGGSHTYRISLIARQYLHIAVDQIGVNVEVNLFDPKGEKIANVDWWWREGTESLWRLVESTGDHKLELRANSKPTETGKYRVKIEKIGEWQGASAVERDYVNAQMSFAEGSRFLAQATAESLRNATDRFQQALTLWRTLKDRDAEAHTLNGLGVVQYRSANLKQAAEYFNQAINLFRDSGNRHGEADSLSTLSYVYNLSGETQKALENYEQGLRLSRAIKDHLSEAQILSGLGLVYHRLGQSQRGLEILNELLSLSRVTGIIDGEASGHNNIGLIYVSQGRLREAIQEYSLTLSALKKSEDRFGQAATINNIGSAYARIGEFQQALLFLHQGLDLRRITGDRRGEAANLGSIGYLYLRLADYPRAIQYYDQSLALSRTIGSRDFEATALGNLATIYGRTRELQKGLDHGNKALALMIQLKDRNGEANILTTLGSIHNQLNDRQQALDNYEKALKLRRDGEDKYGESYTLSALGSVHGQLGHQQRALDYLNQSLGLSRGINDRHGEIATLYELARVEHNRGNFRQARSQIEAALEIVESARTKISLADVRAVYFASRQDIYDFYVDLLMQSAKSEKDEKYLADAIRANERRRARSLLDSLAEAKADIRARISPDLLEREERLQLDLNAKADQQVRLLSRKHAPEQATALVRDIEALTTEFEQVLTQIRLSSPRYAALTQPAPLSLREIQQQVLDNDTLLLEYALGEERSYLWAVSSTTITAHELPSRKEIESLARRIYESLTARGRRVNFETPAERQTRIAAADAAYNEAAGALSRIVLGPVAAQMTKRLLIVGDGALQYLPFAALPSPAAPGKASRPSVSVPLIARHEIISIPSASTLAVLRKELAGRKPALKTIAVIADPVFSKNDERLKTIKPNVKSIEPAPKATSVRDSSQENALTRSARDVGINEEIDFPRLPFTRREAEDIVRFVPETEFKKAVDFTANKSTATDPELSQYRYLHFATHTLLNSTNPGLSGIVLSLVNQRGDDQDGFLLAQEIYNLKLPADLVVLSSCRTGLGQQIKGEGIVGITRGFMYAGAARVLVSLWDVDDESTARMMEKLYGTMLGKQRLSPAAALRSAQISMLKSKRWRAPYFWAAFVLQGEYK